MQLYGITYFHSYCSKYLKSRNEFLFFSLIFSFIRNIILYEFLQSFSVRLCKWCGKTRMSSTFYLLCRTSQRMQGMSLTWTPSMLHPCWLAVTYALLGGYCTTLHAISGMQNGSPLQTHIIRRPWICTMNFTSSTVSHSLSWIYMLNRWTFLLIKKRNLF